MARSTNRPDRTLNRARRPPVGREGLLPYTAVDFVVPRHSVAHGMPPTANEFRQQARVPTTRPLGPNRRTLATQLYEPLDRVAMVSMRGGRLARRTVVPDPVLVDEAWRLISLGGCNGPHQSYRSAAIRLKIHTFGWGNVSTDDATAIKQGIRSYAVMIC